MEASRLPTEVELVYQVMPCNALRTAQEPGHDPHPCSYFRRWGRYHSYDYAAEGPPPQPGIVQESVYVGRGPLVPEVLSGCRKAPILAVGINPNLPGWWPATRSWVNPLFDDYQQYAHYFRYRAIAKLQLPPADYLAYGGGPANGPFSDHELEVPSDPQGRRRITVELQPQTMYAAYQRLLDTLAAAMGWPSQQLAVGEDLAYANMVACPSAKWTTKASPADPSLPAMTASERTGIVTECFHKRRYFLRQLFQSLPAVILIFSQNTANAFNGELRDRLVVGTPDPNEPLEELMGREVRLAYGELPDGSSLDARVIYSPHITGDPEHFAQARARVVAQLSDEAHAGRIRFNPASGHLSRPLGSCVFCPMLQIGPCDYLEELRPLTGAAPVAAGIAADQLDQDKQLQAELLGGLPGPAGPVEPRWAATDAPQSP
jgi:hypothetical protein